jgi:nucleoside-diphosphate-sugar epimerase
VTKSVLSQKWVLVTGSLGFIGSNVSVMLKNKGYNIIHVIRIKEGLPQYSNDGGNIYCSFDGLPEIFKKIKITAVIHLATKYGRNGEVFDVFQSNLNLPLKILQLCVQHECNTFLSADTFFGKPIFNYQHLRLYTLSKASLIDWVKICCKQNPNLKFVNLRLEHVYGPGDSLLKFIPDIILKLKMNQKEIPMTSGIQIRDFVYVDDVSSLYLDLLEKTESIPTGFNEYEVGTGIGTSIRKFADLACSLVGSESRFLYGAVQTRENEIMESIADIEPLRSFGWIPSVPLEEGLAKTIMSLNK